MQNTYMYLWHDSGGACLVFMALQVVCEQAMEWFAAFYQLCSHVPRFLLQKVERAWVQSCQLCTS